MAGLQLDLAVVALEQRFGFRARLKFAPKKNKRIVPGPEPEGSVQVTRMADRGRAEQRD